MAYVGIHKIHVNTNVYWEISEFVLYYKRY